MQIRKLRKDNKDFKSENIFGTWDELERSWFHVECSININKNILFAEKPMTNFISVMKCDRQANMPVVKRIDVVNLDFIILCGIQLNLERKINL